MIKLISSIDGYSYTILHSSTWLQRAIGLPNSASDVLIVLDCFIDAPASGPSSLPDGLRPSARYGIVGADYSSPSIGPPLFSKHVMRALEHPARSSQAANWHSVRNRIEQELRLSRDPVELVVKGNEGMGSIILTPILW